jgi:hypothetical protein
MLRLWGNCDRQEETSDLPMTEIEILETPESRKIRKLRKRAQNSEAVCNE